MVLAGLVVALLLAGVASHYASARPDGLERVADTVGFGGSAEDSATSQGPLAGYSLRGVDDPQLAGGLAGAAGVVVTLLLAGTLGWAVRRRRPASEPAEPHVEPPTPDRA